jgi:hypothetical protein
VQGRRWYVEKFGRVAVKGRAAVVPGLLCEVNWVGMGW